MRRGRFWAADSYLVDSSAVELNEVRPTVTTDARGRFRLDGFGAERIIGLTIEGPGIASDALNVITRQIAPVAFRSSWIYGADFTFTAVPTRPVQGILRDAKTRRPLAGFEIRADPGVPQFIWQARVRFRTATDAGGRFRLLGLPTGWKEGLWVVPSDDQCYFSQRVPVADTPGLDLQLLSPLNDDGGIPRQGKNLVTVASVHGLLRIRIFDGDGKMAVDTDERSYAKVDNAAYNLRCNVVMFEAIPEFPLPVSGTFSPDYSCAPTLPAL